MKTLRVKDLMVLLEEYATVSEDANLYDAVLALEEAQSRFRQDLYKHRAVLVYDKDKDIVGKLSQLDVIRGLESGYKKVGDLRGVAHSGFSPELIRSMIEKHGLWQRPLEDVCRTAPRIRVKDVMYTPTEGEYVEEDATIDRAIHQLVVGHHQSLLVTRGEKIVGILRLTDVFSEICKLIKACQE
ncbi:MAG: CBS domain-containing protein [Proteobacteria bacterium]|nr:CBS domain-containing protein [Pseudomonadota bacterium]